MPLRKALLFSSTQQNNAASFTNLTNSRLHIRKLDLNTRGSSTAGALGDAAFCSIDEVPVAQAGTNDSRSHIMGIGAQVIGGTGAIEANGGSKVLSFNRNDLVLDPDEAIFMNIENISGAMDMGYLLNVWYED